VTGSTTGGVDYNISCHSPSTSSVSVPGHIFSIAVNHHAVTSHLFHAQDSWRQADSISEQSKGENDLVQCTLLLWATWDYIQVF